MQQRTRRLLFAAVAATSVTSVASAALNPWMLVALPDTQNYVERQSLPTSFNTQTEWIVDNKTTNNIKFVTHLGDVTNQGWNNTQWSRAVNAVDTLKNSTIPFGIAPGNHDHMNNGPPQEWTSTKFIDNFGPQYFAGKSFYGGASPSQYTSYQTFTAGGRDFIVIQLDCNAPDADLNWATSVINANPGKPVIISTHEYLGLSGRDNAPSVDLPGRNSGNQIWNEFVKVNPEIFLVLNGHISSQNQQRSFNNSNQSVIELLSDYQAIVNAGNGFLRTLTFNPDNGEVFVQTYSPTLGRTLQTQDREADLNGPEGLDGAANEIGAIRFFVDFDKRLAGGDGINRVTWQNGVSGNWSDADKWTDNTSGLASLPPGSGLAARITFAGAVSYTATSDLGKTIPPPINALVFTNTAGTVTIDGTSPIDMEGAGGTTTATITDTGAGGVSISAPITLSVNTTANITGDMTVNNTIGGSGNFTKNGAGNLIFGSSGRFTTSGDITINTGSIRLAANGAIPAATTVSIASGASLDDSYSSAGGEGFGGLTGSGTFMGRNSLNLQLGESNVSSTFSGKITAGTNGVVGSTPTARQLIFKKAGTGTIVLTGSTNDFAGQTQVLLGTLSIPSIANRSSNSPVGIGDVTNFGDGAGANLGVDFALGDAATATTLADDVILRYTGSSASTNRTIKALGAGATIEVTSSAANLSVSGAITGTGTLIKTGAGTLTFANDFSPPITVSAGKFAIAASAPTDAPINLAGGSVEIAPGSGVTWTLGKPITGTGVFTKTGAGTVALTTDSNFAANVNIQITGGTLQTAANDAVNNNATVSISSGATWDDSSGNGEVFGGLSGNGRYIMRGATGPNLGGTNTTAAFGGQITVGMNGVIGATNAARALTGFNKIGTGTLTYTGTTSDFQAKVHAQAGILSFSNLANRGLPSAVGVGNAGATADLAVGTATATATLRYTGPTVATDRTLEVQHATGSNFDVSTAGATLGLAGVSGANATAGLTKVGAGTLQINGPATYTGATSVIAGKLVFGQSMTTSPSLSATGATIELLAGGDKRIKTGTVTTTSGGKIDLRDNDMIVTGQTSADVASLVAAGRGNGTWNGTGIVTSMTAAVSSQLTTLAVAAASEVGLTSFNGNSVAGSDVLVMYTYAGDVNFTGTIDADDYFVIDSSYGKPMSAPQYFKGDLNYSGNIDGDDFFLIDANFAAQGSSLAGAAGVQSVPEPVTPLILAAMAMAQLSRRRRRI